MTTTNNNPPLDPAALRKLAQDALELAEEAIMGPWDLVEEPLEVNELGQERGIKPSRFLTIRTHWRHAQLKAPAPIIWQMFSPYYTQKHYATIHHEETGRFMAASRQLVPDLATALLVALDRVSELEKVNKAARSAVYNCTLATGIGYWQELANAVFEYEADERE